MHEVDVYPVGFFSDLRHGKVTTRGFHSLCHHVKERNWRGVRSYFNGYLAEPKSLPPGLRRCGSGWTKRRALNSLDRELAKLGGSQ